MTEWPASSERVRLTLHAAVERDVVVEDHRHAERPARRGIGRLPRRHGQGASPDPPPADLSCASRCRGFVYGSTCVDVHQLGTCGPTVGSGAAQLPQFLGPCRVDIVGTVVPGPVIPTCRSILSGTGVRTKDRLRHCGYRVFGGHQFIEPCRGNFRGAPDGGGDNWHSDTLRLHQGDRSTLRAREVDEAHRGCRNAAPDGPPRWRTCPLIATVSCRGPLPHKLVQLCPPGAVPVVGPLDRRA